MFFSFWYKFPWKCPLLKQRQEPYHSCKGAHTHFTLIYFVFYLFFIQNVLFHIKFNFELLKSNLKKSYLQKKEQFAFEFIL